MTFIIPPDRLHEEPTILSRISQGAVIDHFETARITKTGRRIEVSATISPIRDVSGRIIGISKIARDITARKQAETALLESERRFRTLTVNLPDIVSRYDRELRLVYANPAREAASGLSLEVNLGKTATELNVPAKTQAAMNRVFTTQQTERLEVEHHGPNGPTHWESTLVPEPGVDGSVSSVLVVSRDITARKKAEAALRESQERFQLALESAQIGDWELDLVTLAARRSAQHDKIFGYSGLLGAWSFGRFLEHVHPDDRARVGQTVNDSIAAGRDWYFECRIVRTDQAVRFIWVRGKIFPDLAGKPARALGMVADITERHESEEKIRQLNATLEERVRDRTAQLEAINRELEAFSYSVSHDLRAPLRHIDGFTGLLQKNVAAALDEKGRRYLGVISDAARQMGRLIDDLLSFSRMGRAPLNAVSLDHTALVAAVIRDGRFGSAERSPTWVITELPGSVADAAMLRQVWFNLIDNAVKYSGHAPQPRIEIGHRHATATQEAAFYVRDNGVGFDMKYAGKLFGVFQRLHSADDFPGTGVGLANVHRIIARHGGRVWAESQPGAGATFYFSLPAPAA